VWGAGVERLRNLAGFMRGDTGLGGRVGAFVVATVGFMELRGVERIWCFGGGGGGGCLMYA
jgi:hypothetical protein